MIHHQLPTIITGEKKKNIILHPSILQHSSNYQTLIMIKNDDDIKHYHSYKFKRRKKCSSISLSLSSSSSSSSSAAAASTTFATKMTPRSISNIFVIQFFLLVVTVFLMIMNDHCTNGFTFIINNNNNNNNNYTRGIRARVGLYGLEGMKQTSRHVLFSSASSPKKTKVSPDHNNEIPPSSSSSSSKSKLTSEPTNNNPTTTTTSTSTTPQLFTKRSKSWIIIVDDEESIRLSLGNYLYDSGYSVTACSDPEALMDLLSTISTGGMKTIMDCGGKNFMNVMRSSSSTSYYKSKYEDRFPNVIVCDIRIPGSGMDGLDLLTVLKNPMLSIISPSNEASSSSSQQQQQQQQQQSTSSTTIKSKPTNKSEQRDWDYIRQQWKRIPVVLLTAKSLTQDRIEGYKRGADVYLPKPFSPEELLSVVDNLIERTDILTSSTNAGGSAGGSAAVSSSSSSSSTGEAVTLEDLKGDIMEIKGILKERDRMRKLLKSSDSDSGTTNESGMTDTLNTSGNKVMNGIPSSSALVPSKKKRSSSTNIPNNNNNNNNNSNNNNDTKINGQKISQSEMDAFNEQVKLTPGEKEILNLLSQGYTNAEIAKVRGYSSTTRVSRVISSMYTKTLTKTRTELVKWGMKMGYISLE